jgi:hypothetical protein
LGELEEINDRIIELIEGNDVLVQQNTQHLKYASTIDDASSLVENYLFLRQGDAPSVVVETTEETTRRQALAVAEQELRDNQTEISTDESEVNPSDSVLQVGQRVDLNSLGSTLAPDAWIEVYLAGREETHVREREETNLR